jgi:hypothetical protein
MGDLSDYIKLGFGWLLGILGPAVIELVRKGYRRKELLRGLAVELHELRFRIALVLLMVRKHTGTMTRDDVHLIRPLLEAASDRDDREVLARSTLKLLANGEEEYVRMSNAAGDRSHGKWPVAEEAPYLTHVLGEVTLLSRAQQQIVLRIASEIRLYANQVVFVRRLNDRTFDGSISEVNHRATTSDLHKATERLGDRARILVEQISRLLGPTGNPREAR